MTESADARSLALKEIRLEIDAIDDRMCALLEERFAAIEKVRSAKSMNDGNSFSPIRPAREATVLNRLLNRPGWLVPAELKVRLWRAIMSAATLNQAPVTINVSAKLGTSVPLRLMIRDHFGSIPVVVHANEISALAQTAHQSKELCIVEPQSEWAGAFLAGLAGEARVIGCLPFLLGTSVPELLIFGHAKPEATGHDVTLQVSKGMLDADLLPSAMWQVISGGCHVTAFAGFHVENGSWLAHLGDSDGELGPQFAGHYASAAGDGS